MYGSKHLLMLFNNVNVFASNKACNALLSLKNWLCHLPWKNNAPYFELTISENAKRLIQEMELPDSENKFHKESVFLFDSSKNRTFSVWNLTI